MSYEKLGQSLIDWMKEQQAKLGYRKESIRLYYPLSSLNHLFGSADTAEEMQERLDHFPEEWMQKLGKVKATHSGERFCFRIPEEGSEYVHAHMGKEEFIVKLVGLMWNHGVTMDQIQALFEEVAEGVRVERVEHGEFDYVIRFPEGHEDPYYYCFKDEGCHITYHRFLPEDYEDFGF